MKLARLNLALAVVALLASTASAQHVLSLDGSRTSNGGYSGADFYLTSSSMPGATQVLMAAGMTVATTDRFLNANLAGADVLFTGLTSLAYTSQELSDVQAFVAAGGGLVMIRDISSWGGVNDALAGAFGVSYNSAISGGGGPPTLQMSMAHPVWNGPGGTLSGIDQYASSSIQSGAVALGLHAGDGRTGIAVVTFGAGNVVFLTDIDAFGDSPNTPEPSTSNDLGVLWHNIFDFAAGSSLPSGTPYCFGDSTGANCPCSAFGAAGEGCINTTGTGGARIDAFGVASLNSTSFRIEVTGVPGAKAGLILRGDTQVANPVGDGILCVAGSSQRSQVQLTVAGETSFTDFKGAPFAAVANVGTPTNFQFWYRDPNNPCGQGGFNFSNGVSVVFQP